MLSGIAEIEIADKVLHVARDFGVAYYSVKLALASYLEHRKPVPPLRLLNRRDGEHRRKSDRKQPDSNQTKSRASDQCAVTPFSSLAA